MELSGWRQELVALSGEMGTEVDCSVQENKSDQLDNY
jgi:hypothetical protein